MVELVSLGPGAEVGGFLIESVAGRGGMGVVYRARQRRPDRVVALKVIAPDLAQDVTFRARFEREAAVAAQIEHPNVIPVYAVGEENGILFLAMRFIEGTDLGALLARAGRLEPRRAAALIDQAAQALDAAHGRGLVHRDVKPANMLIWAATGREHVYLTDFGLSRHIEGSQAMTRTGVLLGTIDYIAPEQVRGERVDARTDVYSLGCVLFEALTGTVPYPLDNEFAKLYAHEGRPPPSVCERATDVPKELDAVVSRAMAKAPEQRYLSAGDLGRAALAAASHATLSRAERSGATGVAAAPGAEVVPAPPAQTPGEAGRAPEQLSTVPPPAQKATSEPSVDTPAETVLAATEAAAPSEPSVDTPRETVLAAETAAPNQPSVDTPAETVLAAETAPPAPKAPARHRRRRRIILAGLGVAAIGAAAVVIAVTGSGTTTSPSRGPGLAAQLPAAFGAYHRAYWINGTNNSDSFSIGYATPGYSVITYEGDLKASVTAAQQDAASSISFDQQSVKGVNTRTVGGITYTATGSARDTTSVHWRSGRVSLTLDTRAEGIPAPEALSLAAEAQAATKFS
jgi:tRNA A-37 threonylcarbamoyl transferase component Bud32